MKYLYRVREDSVPDETGVLHTVYGIEVLTQKGDLLPAYTLPDLFDRFDRANELARLCTKLELEPIHLFDVAEDALV